MVCVVVLAHEGDRLAREDDEVETERVETRQERPDQRDDPEDHAVPVRVQRGGDDRVLREEAAERRQPDECERAGEEGPARPRHQLPDAAHLADVLFAGERMDRDTGGHEEQRLEEGVRHQVEHPVRVGAEPRAEEHVADLRHRRVGDHALDVRLNERDQPGHHEGDGAEPGGEVLHLRRQLEERVAAHDQVHARDHHRRRVDQRADRRGPFHRVRQPGLQRELRRLGDGAAEQAERDEVDDPVVRREPRCAGEDGLEVQ